MIENSSFENTSELDSTTMKADQRHSLEGMMGMGVASTFHAILMQSSPKIFQVFSCIPSYFHLLLVIMISHSDQLPISLVFFCYCLSSILNSDYCFNLTIQIKWRSCSIVLVYCYTTSNFVLHNELA